jgi:nicotinate-nucleotide--dimethylbenzimidazole phosphoribosyltransferase
VSSDTDDGAPAGDPAAPGRERLAAVLSAITRPDEQARIAARERLLARPARGRLDELGVWLAGVQSPVEPAGVRPLDRVRMLLVAGDHGVADAGVSGRPAGSTQELVRATVAGESATARVAAGVAVDVRPVLLDGSTPRVDTTDAATGDETVAALLAGVALADAEADAGADAIVLAATGRGLGTVASALVGVLTKRDASAVTSRGPTLDDALWMRRAAVVRDTMRRGRPRLGDHVGLLATIGGPDLATATGLLLGAAARRTPVLLDGLVVGAAALLADELAAGAREWWLLAQRSPDPAMALVEEHLHLSPVLDLGVRIGDGTGAVAAVPLLQMAARLLAETGTVTSSP